MVNRSVKCDAILSHDVYLQTSFANTSSLLVVTENALDELNSRLQTQPLPIDRFRGNIVLRLTENGSSNKHPEVRLIEAHSSV